ncbi:MAG: type II secretion system minor pseudopilin GspK [Rehaibacterium terrae]|uniref:type II secretion system minor pseudopilin GspK n=1 Tax=Rehaibacterium terrae TaxID=1341696 RepID=UPI00391898E9
MRRQRGVALIVAMLAVALAVLLVAGLLDRGEASRAQLRDHWRAEQGWQLMAGLEAWAAEILREHAARSGGVDALGDAWAQPMPPVDIPGARITGRLRDLGGCFDLNSLAPQGVADEQAIRRFERLLRALGLDPRLAAEAADWIDVDHEPRADGAEDSAYAGLAPGHRVGNRPLAHASELKRLRSMDMHSWQTLAPFVCALPTPAPLNLNTAPWPLWTTLDDAVNENIARRLAREPGSAYGSMASLQLALQREGIAADLRGYGLGSAYFLAEAQIEADGIPFAYSSLLQRQGLAVRVVARLRGAY